MNHQRNPIQAVFGDSFFLKHRIYIALGIGSILANICLVFADLILFWMEIAFLVYHVSSTSKMNFITANFVFPFRLWLSKLKIQDRIENVAWLQAKMCINSHDTKWTHPSRYRLALECQNWRFHILCISFIVCDNSRVLWYIWNVHICS